MKHSEKKKIVSFSSNNTFWIFSFKAMGTIDAVFIESTNSVFLVMVLIVLILILFISSSSFSSKRNVKESPGPRAFPLLGNLLQLDLKRLDISWMEVSFFLWQLFRDFFPPLWLIYLSRQLFHLWSSDVCENINILHCS